MADIILATINAKWIHPSLALRLLKANLGGLEDRCEILEFALRQPLKEKTEPIFAARPRLLALSVSIWNHLATIELLEALEEQWKAGDGTAPRKPLVVLGGPEVSWLPENAEIFRHADYVIRGEGEESFRSLCEWVFGGMGEGNCGLDHNEPKLSSGPAVFVNRGETTVNVSKIASAYHLYTDEDLSRKLVYVEASRGCPFSCDFCQGGLQSVREFPLEPFLESMGTLINRGVRQFKFLDRTFNLNIDRAIKIMEFFLDRLDSTKEDLPLCVHFEMVPFRFQPELKDVLRRFPPGSLRLELGIQSFNPHTATLIHRSAKPGEEIETLEFLRGETGAIIHADLIAGLPGEDLASFGAGFDRLLQALSGKNGTDSPGPAKGGNFEIQLGILKCLPGTAIKRHNQDHQMRYAPEPPYEVMETGALSSAELERIKNFARFWEILVNRNPFPDLMQRLLTPGAPVFEKFIILSDRLLEKFGRNWGIDRGDLRSHLEGINF